MDGPSAEDLNELLVFGYASKVYRDDERAEWIENGGHLMPLFGDTSILIDRYDGRGALTDTKACEPLRDGSPVLTKEELQMERWCDLERYRDCQDEEELENDDACLDGSRNGISDLNDESSSTNGKPNNYASLPYSYDSSSNDNDYEEDVKKSKNRDYAYAPPPGLYVPPDLILPETMKSHAVIEKTAKFIASHGTQMEIILKTKQGSNPMFNFLTLNDRLNPYYKYLVTAIKTHAYKPVAEVSLFETSPHGSDSDDEDHYLHPSLVPKLAPPSAETKASRLSEYRVTGPSAYSTLVSKIQEITPQVTEEAQESWNPEPDLCHGDQLTGNRCQPTGESLAIIEKMANYVVKNGPAFESLASTKGDARFKFLDPSHPHHWYYIACKESYQGADTGRILANKFVPYASEQSVPDQCSRNVEAVTKKSFPILNRPSSMPPKPPAPNHANALTRMATLPPALIDKIEQLRKKTLENRAKSSEEKIVDKSFPVQQVASECLVTKPSSALFRPLPLISTPAEDVQVPNQSQPEIKSGIDEEQRRAERRRRAALFLEQMKKEMDDNEGIKSSTPPPVLSSAPVPEVNVQPDTETEAAPDGNEVEIIAEVHHEEATRVSVPKDTEGTENGDDTDVEEIGRVSHKAIKPAQAFRKRPASVSSESDDDEDDDDWKSKRHHKHHKTKKRYKNSSSSEDSESDDRHHHKRSHSHSSRKKKSSKKKRRKSDKKKSSSRKSKKRDH